MSMIRVAKLWEKYRIKFIIESRVSWEEIWALEDISLNIDRGEVVGIIGQNGAGKTTFLRLLAGMLIPDKGEINVQGRVAAIMELGAGLNPEFTGRENIILNARVYGISEGSLKKKIDEIITFSNLGKFIDAPIKYYSQGMYMRLAFALAIFAEPDILLIDDILAVGDEEAQQKCKKKIAELKGSGKIIVLVSHDMGMINKLCDRVILFEKGRIIREGYPQSVIPCYLETSGEKAGMAILEQRGLRVVFNNGNLSISYMGNYVSGFFGGYCSSFDSLLKIHTPSTNLFWKITSSSVSQFTAEGKHREDGDSLQYFTVNLHENVLDLSIRNNKNSLKQHNFNLFLISTYNRWTLSGKEGVFPEFSHRTNWHDLGLNVSFGQKFGVFTETEKSLPGLIFETNAESDTLKFFNSGYDQESRIMHLSSFNGQDFSLNIRVCLKQEDFNSYFIQERQLLLVEQEEKAKRLEEERLAEKEAERKRKEQEELYLKEHTIVRDDCRLFVNIPDRRLQIYYQGKEVTAADGLNSIFPLKDLICQRWQVEKVSEDQIILTLNFDFLTQIWSLTFQKDNILNIKVTFEAKDKVFLDNRYIMLELSDVYRNWQTPYEKGGFSSAQYLNDMAPVRFKNSKIYSIAVSSRQTDQPRIVFDITVKDNYTASIYKQKINNQEVVCLSFQSIVPWAERTIHPGRHDLFNAKITFNCQRKLKKEHSLATSTVIARKDLKFVFTNGKGSIFWEDKELTFGLGVYTAVRSKSIWYDSCQAMWNLIKKNKFSAVFLGKWPYIPISQLWEVEFISDNTIRWVINMEVHQEVNIEIEQASIMLLDEYKGWSVKDTISGKFMDQFTFDYDILPFRYWYGEAGKKSLVVGGKGLPTVVFSNKKPNQMPRALIENSDYLYHSRLLQYQNNNNKLLVSKKRLYFSGVIKIGNK